MNRVFLIVLDSFGIGELPDADMYNDVGSNTLKAISTSDRFNLVNLGKAGIFNIDGVACGNKCEKPEFAYGRAMEKSKGKDTTIGHWEISGIVSEKPLPTYPNGFPKELVDEFERLCGHRIICNKTYSGTKVIADYGKQAVEENALILYTSADSVFQLAAHEEYFGLEELYRCCGIARKMLVGDNCVGRVIARPFVGEYPDFSRTANRHDYAYEPPDITMLDILSQNGLDTIGVGKIYDIFAGRGIGRTIKTNGNSDGMEKTLQLQKESFNGLCFVNLVDFDMIYGHRNDVDGYAQAATDFDLWLPEFIGNMQKDDMLIITADHGCDPSTPSTDHSREHIPILVYFDGIKAANLGTLNSYSDIGATVLEAFGLIGLHNGISFYKEIGGR